MAITAPDDRIALLLKILGPDVAEVTLAQMPADQAAKIRRRQSEIALDDLEDDDVDQAIGDFERFFRFAAASTPKPHLAQWTSSGRLEDDSDAWRKKLKLKSKEPDAVDKRLKPDEDPILALNEMEPIQIALALKSETSRTISHVVGCLRTELAAETFKLLTADQRNAVFLHMKQKTSCSPELLDRILRITVEKGRLIEKDASTDENTERDQRMADLLRAMSRQERSEVMEVLEQRDPETTQRIRKLLYVFEDVLRLTDRSMQKLLGEIDTNTLATALKGEQQEYVDKVMKNLSSRAKTSLAEEIELMQSVSPEKREEAQKVTTEQLARLDQAGEIVMEG